MTRTTCHPPLQSLLNHILGEKSEFGDEIEVKTFFLEIATISGQNSEFGDKIKVKTFFFLEIAMISGQNSEFRDEIKVKTFFFFRDHCDRKRKNGESEHSQEWNF